MLEGHQDGSWFAFRYFPIELVLIKNLSIKVTEIVLQHIEDMEANLVGLRMISHIIFHIILVSLSLHRNYKDPGIGIVTVGQDIIETV